MAIILHIETATIVCSISLSLDNELISLKESSRKNSHASMITLLIDEALAESGISLSSIDAVAVSKGPGSYTGLRIGVATAKGLCYALEKPLIAVGTLNAMADGMREIVRSRKSEVVSQKPEVDNDSILYCPMIDARRMEVYYGLYDSGGKEIHAPVAEIIDDHSFIDLINYQTIVFGGDGAKKCEAILSDKKNMIYMDDFNPSAKYMIPLSYRKFLSDDFENLAYFEPYYLKDFIAGKPRIKGLM
ncbi:MAG: tRNA (adenosine(37)-N6)-threonylcarbamoyltransferase complex dimerization subunit type 1 TsaB [Bacteroidetes bacterium]|nr:tRNA (adenosine(37)-N6)-threonylcarbamoyltransferase complex dimerization subunit type 1 TsaB [Bacteroidota bacterium]